MRKFLATIGLALAVTLTAWAVDITLSWGPSPSPNAVGYKVYRGSQSGVYTNTTDVGNVTAMISTNLPVGITTYFAATAYDTNGVESDNSSELGFTPANPTNALPSAVQNFHILSFH